MDRQLETSDASAGESGVDDPSATIDAAAMDRFLALGSVVTVAAGEAIVRQDEALGGVRLVLEGRVAIDRDGYRLREFAAGEFIGDGTLFGPDEALGTLYALAPARVLFIPRDAAIDYLTIYSEFGVAFCARAVRDHRARLGKLGEVYVAHRRLTERMETHNANLREAIHAVEQTARLVNQSPHPVLRIASNGLLLFANGPAAPLLQSWRCAIGAEVPPLWTQRVARALETDAPQILEAAIGERVFGVTIVPLPDLGYANVYAQDVTEARRKAALIEHMALHDELTGLPNRAALRDRLDALVDRAASGSRPAGGALMLVDLDGFESVRALFGHPVSDTLLIEAGRRLDGIVGSTGLVAALGGHHFAVLIEIARAAWNEAGAAAIADAIVTVLSRPFEIDTHRLQVGVRIGITFAGVAPGDSSADALKRADLARHQPTSPTGAYSFYRADLEEALHERHLLEIALHRAIGSDEIEVAFQPKVRVADGRIIGAEALARWRHPTRGMIAPAHFIPIAEQTGAIHLLGEQVLRIACRTAVGWPSDELHVAVNLSALQLRQADIVERVAAVLAETGLPSHRLELEITESSLVEDTEHAAAALERLRGLGVGLSLDDFGTGYSCLAYLASLKFDKLKIDRGFVMGMQSSRGTHKIAQTIVRLGAGLEMTVVAEGVECAEQWQQLRALGCAEGQGFLFSRPLTAAEFTATLLASPLLPLETAR